MAYRVLTIAPTSFFSDYGCHVRILEEVWALQELGNQITICTYHTGNDVPGLDIRRSLDVPWKKGVQVGSSRHKLYFDAMLAYKVARLAAKLRPDVIHAHIHEGALIGWLSRCLSGAPVVFDLQGSLVEEMIDHGFLQRDSRLYRPLRWLESRINLSADRIITSSHNASTMLRRHFGVPAGRVLTVPDCVNVDRFQPLSGEWARAHLEGLKDWLGIPSNRRVVVYLGLLAPYQGTDVLLQAAEILVRRVPDVHFLIMGFPGVDRYRHLASRLGLEGRVTLPGRISYFEAPLYLSLGDVAVSPKMSATEGCGKILNYMAMQLPVVAFDGPVARELLGSHGIYAEMGDPGALAAALERALLDEELAARTALALRSKAVNGLSWGGAARRILDVYDEAVETRNRHPSPKPGPASKRECRN